jgi:hypothetical protein
VVVLVLAVIALRQPNGHQAALDSSPVAKSSSSAAAHSSSAASSAAAASTPASSTAPATSASSTPSPTVTADPLEAIPLVVLNNTNRTGLADTAAQTFRTGGWTVTSTGNLVNDIISTCAYYDPNVPNASAAASALMAQFPAIKRTAAKFSGLPAGPVVVVLTPDYS